jgi:hypothetical protein
MNVRGTRITGAAGTLPRPAASSAPQPVNLLGLDARRMAWAPGRPMRDDGLDAKVRDLAAFGTAFVDATSLIAAIGAIEAEADAARVLSPLLPRR